MCFAIVVVQARKCQFHARYPIAEFPQSGSVSLNYCKNEYSELRKQGARKSLDHKFPEAPFKTFVAALLHLPVSDGQSDPGTEAFDPRIFLTLYSYTD